jgi:hypothetical protein
MPGPNKTKGARNNARRFTRNRKFNSKRERKEVSMLRKMANDRAKLALIMVNIAQRYARGNQLYNEYLDIANNMFSLTVLRNILFQMVLATTGEFNKKFRRIMPVIFSEIEILGHVTLTQFFILVSNKLDLEDVKWGQLQVDSGETSALNAISNISDVLGHTCKVLAFGAQCVGRNDISECFSALDNLTSCIGSSCNAANFALRTHGHLTGEHPLREERIQTMAFTAGRFGAAGAQGNNITKALELQATLKNTEEIIRAAEGIPAAYTAAPRPFI